MRRMYSQAELSAIIKEVFLQDVADGQIDLPALVTASLSEIDWSEFELDCESVTADSIIEKMTGYSFAERTSEHATLEYVYAGAVKNGNKLTFALAMNITLLDTTKEFVVGEFTIPESIGANLYPETIGSYPYLDLKKQNMFSNHATGVDCFLRCIKDGNTKIKIELGATDSASQNTKYYFRYEITFLLSENLAE